MIRRCLTLVLLGTAAPAYAQDERPTGYPRSANERSDKPVTLSAVYVADIRSNVSGGIARGTRYLDNLDLQVAIDADRLVGWHCARLFLYGLYDNGASLSSDLVGDAQGVSNIETGVRAARLFEAWVEQDVGRNASVKVGLYNLNSEFDTTQSGGLFLVSAHGIGPEFAQAGRRGPSIFPVTSLAVRGEVKLGEHWLGRVAVLDGVPGDPAHPARTAVKLSSTDGALVVSEVDYLSHGTKAAIGVWGYTARFDDVGTSDPAAARRGNKGAYVFAEHRLVGSRADDAHGLAGWLRFGVADTRFNRIGRYIGGGLVHTGTAPGRPDDQVGLSVAAAGFGARYRRDHSALDRDRDRQEVVVETVYNAVVTPWLSVQPDLQYVVNPGGDALRKDAVVTGLRIKIGR
ncbi:carbohydrate porin [Sphingomonas sp. R86521]|uniref:carbohydrate porin n=1 Tax=Sphingomonas sp. R86521 TaxID=3093860 RepID=UPI0036D2DFF1